MSRRPRCFYCGRGLSRKHRVTAELRLLLAIFGASSVACLACGERVLARSQP